MKPEVNQNWVPTTTGFTHGDLELPKLIIHFWAKWNAYDQSMDINLQPSIERFGGRVEFRSADIDTPQLQDICRDTKIANVPALVLYTRGSIDHVLIGVREPQVIIDFIEAWLTR